MVEVKENDDGAAAVLVVVVVADAVGVDGAAAVDVEGTFLE